MTTSYFCEKIVPGGADRSYGIQVAKLAGVPDEVIGRAKAICEELEKRQHEQHCQKLRCADPAAEESAEKQPDEVDLAQISLFDTVRDDDIISELKDMDLTNMTPFEAMNRLYELQNKVKNRW